MEETRSPSPSRIFSNTNVIFTWNNHLHHHNMRSLLPIPPRSIDLPLILDDGWLSLSLKTLDYATFTPIVENEAHFVLECPLYNPIRDKFPSLLENLVLGSLKSFFQLDHQVDISFYLTETTTLRHSRELASLKPPRCILNPISSFIFPDFKIDFNSFHLQW